MNRVTSRRLACQFLIMVSAACARDAPHGFFLSGSRGGYIELKPDGHFYMQQGRGRFADLAGEFGFDGGVITFRLPDGRTDKAEVRGDTIIDGDGTRWVRYATTLAAAEARWRAEAEVEAERRKPKAYGASMKSDLRNLITAQESYFGLTGTYASLVSLLDRYRASPDITVDIVAATSSGWTARASHKNSSITCTIFVGDAGGIAITGSAEEPSCSDR